MSNVVSFSKSGKSQVAVATKRVARGDAATDISRMVGIALNAQQAARRGIIIALFDLEMALLNCRKAIALIPEGESTERSKLNDDLYCLEKSLEYIRSIARGL